VGGGQKFHATVAFAADATFFPCSVLNNY